MGEAEDAAEAHQEALLLLRRDPKVSLFSLDISVCSVMCSGNHEKVSKKLFGSELTHHPSDDDADTDNVDSARNTVWNESGQQKRPRYPLNHPLLTSQCLATSPCGDIKYHAWSLRGGTSLKPSLIEILTETLTLGFPATLALLMGVTRAASLAQLNIPLPVTARWLTTTSSITTTFGVDKLRGTSTPVELAQLVLLISILHLSMFV